MEKYRLAGEKRSEHIVGSGEGSSDVCEVKITQQGKPKNYISYAMNLFVSQCLKRKTLKINDSFHSFSHASFFTAYLCGYSLCCSSCRLKEMTKLF